MTKRLLQSALSPLVSCLLLPATLFLGPFQGTTSADDTKPTIEDAIDAWLIARNWVNDLYVPTVDQLDPGEAGPTVEGASLVLRFRGRIIGVGDDYDSSQDAFRQAIAQAVRDARQSSRVRELPFEMIEAVGRETTMELELAGKPTPLLGNSIEETVSGIRPGVDGLAIRRGNRWRWSFPGRMQAFGLADRPGRVIVRLLRELGLPPKEPVELRRIDDVEFYRFEVVILSQEDAEMFPFESIRGTRHIARTPDLKQAATTLAQGAARNLLARLASDPDTDVGEIPGADRLNALGLFGDYDVSTDTFKPLVAQPADQALAAWALARYANEVSGLKDSERIEVRRLAQLVIERLQEVDPVETDPLSDAKTIPMIVLAGIALYGSDGPAHSELDPPPIIMHARDALRQQIKETMKALEDPDSKSELNGSVIALEALAATTWVSQQPDAMPMETIDQLTEAAWRSQPVDRLVSSLHFLLLTERARGAHPDTKTRRNATTVLIEGSIANQIGHSDSLVAPVDPVGDLAGGYVLSGAPRTTATASSLRPALAMAIALRNGWVPPAERQAAWQEALELAIRFARQLQIDAMHDHRTPSPKRAQGGLKSSPWSNLSRTSDSALALLLATEILAESPEPATPDRPNSPRTPDR